jgi:hypothetical protein
MMVSCKKDDKTCNCGLIISDDVSKSSVTIRNSCSGNEKEFVLSQADWLTAFVGSDYCITNVSKW